MSNHDVEPNTTPSADHPPSNNKHEKLQAEAVGLVPPELATVPLVPQEPATAGQPVSEPRPAISDRKREANRLNAQKSTGPRSEAGKLRSSQNARLAVRLLGLAEARTLNQDLNAAGKLYRQMIAPYEPAPPLLARQFEDLARMYPELEACERMRDAQLEHRWEQSDIERRQRFSEMGRDLQGNAAEIFKDGLCRQPDSAARWKKQVECLGSIEDHLTRRDFDFAPTLHFLYGQELNPPSDRAITICIRCAKLTDPEKRSSVSDADFEDLLSLLEEELADAITNYGLRLDEKTVTRAARLARLAPNRDDHWMNRQLERLRHDIDRKLKLILTLLEMFGFEQLPRFGRSPQPRRGNGAAHGGPPAGDTGPNTDSNADSDASSDSGSGSGSNAGADERPGRALPPPKPARRSHPVRHRVKRDKSRRHGRMAVAGRSQSAAAGSRSAVVGRRWRDGGRVNRGQRAGFAPAALTHSAKRPGPLTHPDPVGVSSLPAGEDRGVHEVLAGGRGEGQPSSSVGSGRARTTASEVSPLRRGDGPGVRGIYASSKKGKARLERRPLCAKKFSKGTQEVSCNQQIDPRMGQNEAN